MKYIYISFLSLFTYINIDILVYILYYVFTYWLKIREYSAGKRKAKSWLKCKCLISQNEKGEKGEKEREGVRERDESEVLYLEDSNRQPQPSRKSLECDPWNNPSKSEREGENR